MEKRNQEDNAAILKYVIGVSIACLVVLLILLVTGVFDGSPNKKKGNMRSSQSAKPSEVPRSNSRDTLLGVVKNIDEKEGIYTVLLIETGEEKLFTYDGTTSFTSRYKQPLTAGEIAYGEIVEITFDIATSKLKTCDITDKAWEYKEIRKWQMDKTSKSIVIGTKKYQYTNQFYAFDHSGEIDTNRLSNKDQVTIKGIAGQAYSIIVTKGHGYLTLTGCDAFLNGTIEVGYDIITTVTEDMVLPLGEGEYKVTIMKDGLSATKYIKLMSGEDYTLDFSEYKVEKVQTGKCYFDITPAGADLYIDDTESDYTRPIELKYGEYEVRVECAGYQTYHAKLKVGNEKEVLTITLVDENSITPSQSPSPGASDESPKPSTFHTPVPIPSSSPKTTASASPTGSPKTNTTNKIHIYSPIGASVYLNNQYKGTIPATFDKVIGDDMNLTLMMTGKDSKSYTVTVKDDDFDVVWSFEEWWN